MKNFKNYTDFKITPLWVTGITDAEGNFSINVHSLKNKIHGSFKVTQKSHSTGILYGLQKFFNCGTVYIDNKKEDSYKYIVSNFDDLSNIIIPHFDKYTLVSSKYLDYLDFKKALHLFENNQRLNNKNSIISIKSRMNSKRSFDNRWDHFNTSPIISDEWLQAFIDGEGSFQFLMSNSVNRGKPYLITSPTLEIAQSSHDVKLLAAIKLHLNTGYLKPKYDISNKQEAKASRSVNRLIITDKSVVISFVDKYPMFTRKNLDYLDWKKLVQLKYEGAHKTDQGKSTMYQIKQGMNLNRSLSMTTKPELSNINNISNIRYYNNNAKKNKITKDDDMGSNSSIKYILIIWKLIKKATYFLSMLMLGVFVFICHMYSLIHHYGVEYDLYDYTDAIPDDTVESKPKPSHIEYERIESADSEVEPNRGVPPVIPWFDGLSDEEIKRIDIYMENMHRFITNRGIQIIDTSQEKVDLFRLRVIMAGETLDDVSDSESELSETLIREIRSGNDVVVYSDDEESVGSPLVSTPTGSQFSEKESPDKEPLDSGIRCGGNWERLGTEITDTRYHEQATSSQETIRRIPRHVVIITKPAGDSPMPLPSWHEVSEPPSRDNIEERAKWEKDVAIKKYWASRFPWMSNNTPFSERVFNEETIAWIGKVGTNLPEENPSFIALPPQGDDELKELENVKNEANTAESLEDDKKSLKNLERWTK